MTRIDLMTFSSMALIFFFLCLLDSMLHRSIMYISLPIWLISIYRIANLEKLFEIYMIKLVVILYSYVIISLAWSHPADMKSSIGAIVSTIAGLIFLFTLAASITREQTEQLLRLYILGTVLTILIALGIHYHAGVLFDDRLAFIWRGKNASVAGSFIGLAIVFLAALSCNKMLRSYWWDIILLFLLFGLILTLTRTAFYGVVTSLLLILTFSKNEAGMRNHDRRCISTLCIIAGAYILSYLTSFHDISRLHSFADNSRFEMWPKSFEMSMNSPFVGHGIGSLHQITLESGKIIGSVHNIWLGTFYHLGILGVLFFILIYLILFKGAFQSAYRHGDCLLLAILSYGFTVGLFDFHTLIVNLHREWLIWFLPMALYLQRYSVRKN